MFIQQQITFNHQMKQFFFPDENIVIGYSFIVHCSLFLILATSTDVARIYGLNEYPITIFSSKKKLIVSYDD